MVYPQFTSEKDARTGEGQQLCPTTNPPGVRDKLEVKVLQRRRGHRRKPGTARSDASFCLHHSSLIIYVQLKQSSFQMMDVLQGNTFPRVITRFCFHRKYFHL